MVVLSTLFEIPPRRHHITAQNKSAGSLPDEPVGPQTASVVGKMTRAKSDENIIATIMKIPTCHQREGEGYYGQGCGGSVQACFRLILPFNLILKTVATFINGTRSQNAMNAATIEVERPPLTIEMPSSRTACVVRSRRDACGDSE